MPKQIPAQFLLNKIFPFYFLAHTQSSLHKCSIQNVNYCKGKKMCTTISKLLLLGSMSICMPLRAETALLLFGASHHWGCDQNRYSCDYHEFNPGLGIEISKQTDNLGRIFARVGSYSDSYGDQARLFTLGLRQDWELNNSTWRLGIGAMAGILSGRRNDTIGLPFVYIARKHLAIELGIAPTRASKQRYKSKFIGTLSIRWDLN